MVMMYLVLVLCVGRALSMMVPLLDDIEPRVGETCGYDSCTQAEAGLLNVHIVPHTHDDVGWLKTVDQYYYGSRNNIQKAGVQYILDSVVKELWQDPKRRFIYVETAFFWKWWTRQSDDVRHKVHVLVRQGRLQMVGGAWSMNDEAASHYHSTIDQFTWGLGKLNETFGACGRPRVGWQIDPFGHSREFASLLAAMGYDGLFLGRIDYQDKRARLKAKNMEMVWRGDDNLGKPSDIFTGVLYNTYSPPPGFCFDVLCDDEPIIDDPDSPIFNVDQRIDKFLDYVTEQGKRYRTNNVLVTMGGDFTYQDAAMWYKNLDKLIQYTNLKAAKDGLDVKLFYSTPDCYLKAVRDANPSLPTKQDDFFPYASDPTAYWTGYFTSRPTTKYFEREGNNFLQMVKQLQVLTQLQEHNKFVLDELKSAMGVMQHHDAITGTEKQHVAHDYERMLDEAIEDASIIAKQAFNKVFQGDALKPPLLNYERCRFNESSCHVSENKKSFVVTVYNPLAWKVTEPVRIPVVEGNYAVFAPNGEEITSQLIDIPENVRNIPTRQSKATHEVVFLAYLMPLGFKSYYISNKDAKTKRDATYKNTNKRDGDYYINLNDYWKNIKTKPYIDIKNLEDGQLNTDVNLNKDTEKIPDSVNLKNNNDVLNQGKVSEELDVAMLKDKNDVISEDILQLEKIIREAKRNMEKMERENPRDNVSKKLNYLSLNDEEMRMLSDDPMVVSTFDDMFIENEYIKIRVDNATGQITQMIQQNSTLDLAVRMYYWTPCYGDNSNTSQRSSGAYIFRPNITIPFELKILHTQVKKGPIVSEIRITTPGNASSVLRLYSGLNFLEHDFVIGPISVDDNIGKEYVVRYETNIFNDGIFYTDSNGRQMLKRKLSERPQWNLTLEEPIPGNYYPVTNKFTIEDTESRLSVLTDRSQGGTSLVEGNIELMLHRRLLHDDAFGVGEALNEEANGVGLVVRGRHRLLKTNPDNTDELIAERKKVLELHYPPIIFVSDAENLEYKDWLTLTNMYSGVKNSLSTGLHLLTLEPWSGSTLLLRLENYLDKSVNSTIEIDLGTMFKSLKIVSFKETTLAANQFLSDHRKWSWKTDDEFSESFNKGYGFFDNVTKAKDDAEVVMDDGLKVRIKAKQIRTFIVVYEYLANVSGA
ncbi:unnamed protein product [Parnassius apollo]|uniref:alpha-mannosidase n=1 Tax=Parnassius apollo TaxID=110799 RepID=A0A8S3WU23_PARAO|nr:unnamed protein product [Parnassius apollo]